MGTTLTLLLACAMQGPAGLLSARPLQSLAGFVCPGFSLPLREHVILLVLFQSELPRRPAPLATCAATSKPVISRWPKDIAD